MLPTSANKAYSVGVIDCVALMLAFKERHPAAIFDLAPNMFAVTIPGHERIWALSLCRLMAKLEAWEAEQGSRTVGSRLRLWQ